MTSWQPMRMGWQCPGCGRCYAPVLPACTNCAAKASEREKQAAKVNPTDTAYYANPPKVTGKFEVTPGEPDGGWWTMNVIHPGCGVDYNNPASWPEHEVPSAIGDEARMRKRRRVDP